MKLKKLLIAAAPITAAATITPIALTACSKQGDIYLYDNISKDQKVTYSVLYDMYFTPNKSIFIGFNSKYSFADTEISKHTFEVKATNKKINNVESEKFLIGLSGSFAYDSKTKMCDSWSGEIGVQVSSGVEIKTGDVFTFDMTLALCECDATTKEITKKLTGDIGLGSWKLTVA